MYVIYGSLHAKYTHYWNLQTVGNHFELLYQNRDYLQSPNERQCDSDLMFALCTHTRIFG